MTAYEASDSRTVSVPSHVYPVRAGVIGGAVGGVAMAAVAMVYGAVWRGSPWLPINVVAATLLRDLQTASPTELAQFNANALMIGGVMHVILSIGLGALFALLLPTMPGSPIGWALTVGPLLWVIATVITLPLVNPLGANVIDWPSFIAAHMAYGLVMGLYVAHTPKVPA
ncbi:MAG: hypothetical protein U0559_08375 [Anaerolineae bacterium]